MLDVRGDIVVASSTLHWATALCLWVRKVSHSVGFHVVSSAMAEANNFTHSFFSCIAKSTRTELHILHFDDLQTIEADIGLLMFSWMSGPFGLNWGSTGKIGEGLVRY